MTLRNGRYVIPVRADARGRVRGIVHDQSGSGQTLFVEPLVAVDLANAWREAQLAVTAEEERILDELSAEVGSQRDSLSATLEALARFDLLVCRARLAEEMDAIRPAESRSGEVVAARRPATRGSPGTVVPDRRPARRRLHGARHHGPEHRRQDRRAADRRAARAHAPGRAPRPRGRRQRGCRSSATSSPTSATSSRWRSRSRRSAATCARSSGSSGGRPRDARPARRARRGHGPDGGLGARPGAPRPLHPCRRARHRDDPLRGAQDLRPRHPEGAQRLGRVRRRDARPTYRLSIGLPGTSQAFAIAERLGLRARARRGRPLPALLGGAGVRGHAGLDPRRRIRG